MNKVSRTEVLLDFTKNGVSNIEEELLKYRKQGLNTANLVLAKFLFKTNMNLLPNNPEYKISLINGTYEETKFCVDLMRKILQERGYVLIFDENNKSSDTEIKVQ